MRKKIIIIIIIIKNEKKILSGKIELGYCPNNIVRNFLYCKVQGRIVLQDRYSWLRNCIAIQLVG